MADLLENNGRSIRFIHGEPIDVELVIEDLQNEYQVTSVCFYVVENHLEVVVMMVHERELTKARLAGGQIPAGLKLRPTDGFKGVEPGSPKISRRSFAAYAGLAYLIWRSGGCGINGCYVY